MASVNRYTQTQNTTYEPRTLQELMMVPAYKRKQHDEINAGIAEYETQLAQADSLDLHNDALQEEQDRLYKQMIAQRDKLDSQGFNQSAKSDFIRFNKEYQQAIGPQGRLGKIGAAKTAYDNNKAAGIQTLIKQGYNPDDAAAYWDKHSQSYNDSYDGKNITNIGELYGTGFRDPVAEAHEMMGKAGYTSNMLKNDLGTGRIVQDPKTGTYVETSKFYEKYGSNASQLKGVIDYYNKQVMNPKSEVGQSLAIQQRDPNQVMDEIMGLETIYNKSETDRGSGLGISNYTPISPKETAMDGLGLTAISSKYNNPDTARDYIGTEDKITELSSKENLTQDEKIELKNAQDYKVELDDRLANMPGAKELVTQLDNLKAQADALSRGEYQLTDDEKTRLESLKKTSSFPRDVEIAFKSQLTTDKLKQLTEINTALEPYMEKAATDIRLLTNSYAITPDPNNSKQNIAYKNFKQSVKNVILADGQALKQSTNIYSVTDDQGNTFTELSPNDLDNISSLIYNGDPNSVEISKFTPKSQDGLPGYTVKVRVNDSYDLDNKGFIHLGDDTLGGEDKYITIDLSFKDIKDDSMIRNLNGFAQDYLTTVGQDGRALVQEMNYNRTRDDYKGYTWNELINNDQIKNDGNLSSLYIQTVKNYLSRKNISNPTREEFEAATQVVNNTMIQ